MSYPENNIRSFPLFNVDKEINIELFAGGGGVGAGAAKLGMQYDIAINHSLVALSIHRANFAHTIQMINDVFEFSPMMVTHGSLVAYLHLSPDCTYHTKAKGKALDRHTVCGDDCSVDHTKLSTANADRIRGLGWVGIGYAAAAKPRCITLENVEEFQDWGPTMVNQKGEVIADKTKKGQTFEAFKGVLSTGIRKNHPALKEIRAFLKPFLGAYYNEKALIRGLGYDVEFKVLTASDYGAPTSRKRLFMIARCDGVPIKWPEKTHGDPESAEVKSGKLKPWHTAGECIDWSIPAPSIFKSKKEIKEELGVNTVRPLAYNTMRRIAKGIQKFVVDTDNPYIVAFPKGKEARPYIQTYYGETNNSTRGSSLHSSLHTITAGGQRHGLTVPLCCRVEEKDTAASYVVNFKGTNPKTMPIGNRADTPLTTITTSDSHGVVMAKTAKLAATFTTKFRGTNLGFANNEPAHTITSGGIHFGDIRAELARPNTSAAHILKFYGNEKDGHSAHNPLHTITTKERFGMIESKTEIEPMDDDKRYGAWWVARMMEEYADADAPQLGGIPLPRKKMVTLKNGFAIYDIGMRMFTPKELFKAQGFDDDFVYDPIIEVEKNGKITKRRVNKTEAVKMVGNSVPPHLAAAILKAQKEAEAEYYEENEVQTA